MTVVVSVTHITTNQGPDTRLQGAVHTTFSQSVDRTWLSSLEIKWTAQEKERKRKEEGGAAAKLYVQGQVM